MNYWLLLGILVVLIGFALRLNPMAVVAVAGVVTALVAGLSALEILAAFGAAFRKSRGLMIFILTIPVISLLEWHGLRHRAETFILRFSNLGLAGLLQIYLLIRQLAAALGLTHLGGHAQSVRPLLVPMAEAVQQRDQLEISNEKLRAHCAATDNVALFFGEDLFLAFGAVLLMQSFLAQYDIQLSPIDIARWGIPTAIAAFLIHAIRLWWLARSARRDASANAS
jgi:uncharacterized membrane protein